MRTVLALDDLLAQAVVAQLPGVTEVFRHTTMRDEGADIVREAVEAWPCALVLGGQEWDPHPLALLERWRLPYAVPVVLVAPSMNHIDTARAARLDVFSVLDMEKVKRGLPTSIVSECLLAHAWRNGIVQRPKGPVLVQPSPQPRSSRPGLAPVLRLDQLRPSGIRDSDRESSPTLDAQARAAPPRR